VRRIGHWRLVYVFTGDSSLCVASLSEGVIALSLAEQTQAYHLFWQFNHILCNAPKSITHAAPQRARRFIPSSSTTVYCASGSSDAS
jgi:hypothetical protein